MRLRWQRIKCGDIVTILSLITPETIYCIYALNYIGAVANMGYLSLSEDEIVQMVEKTKSKAVIVLDVVEEKVMHVQKRLTSELTIILPVESSMPWLMKAIVKMKKKKLHNDGKQVLTYPSFIKKICRAETGSRSTVERRPTCSSGLHQWYNRRT